MKRAFIPIFGVLSMVWVAAIIMLAQNPAQAAFTTDPTCTQEIGTWQTVTASPNNHIEGASAVVNGKIYLLTGFGSFSGTLHASNKVSVYDPATDTWETRPNPTPLEASHIQGAAEGQYIWVAGGFVGSSPGTVTDQVWRYDTINDSWLAGPSLPEPRASGGVVVLGRNLHYISGLIDRRTDAAQHWVLNLDDTSAGWQALPNFPRPRNHFQAVALEGKIYAVGGQTGHDGPHTDRNYADVYDPITNQWQPISNLPGTRSHAEMGTFVANERIMMVGGRRDQQGENPVNTVLEYNPQSDSWAQIATLPKNLISPTAKIVGDVIVVSGGGVNWYTPQSDTWIAPLINNCNNSPRPTNLRLNGSLTSGTVRPDVLFDRPTLGDGSPAEVEWYNLILVDGASNIIVDSWFMDTDVCVGDTCTLSFSLGQLPTGLTNGLYQVAVRSWAEGVFSEFSETLTFTVDVPAPAVPQGLTFEISTGRPILVLPDDPGTTWLQVYITGTGGYVHWWWYEKTGCSDGVCTMPLDAHPANGSYEGYIQTWGPAGYNNGDPSFWNGPFPFELSLPTPAPATNLNATVTEGQVTLTWDAVDHATWYYVWVGSPDFTTTSALFWYTALELGCTTTCALTPTLNSGSYAWYIQSWGPGGLSDNENEGWSAGETFILP